MATYQQMMERGDAAGAKAHMLNAGSKVQKRRKTESAALTAAADAQRVIRPVVVTGVTLADTVTVIQPGDFGRVNIDDHYQRERNHVEVNRLISVMQSGGAIPDPVHIAERTDGSWWVVEGQQRFHAHDALKAPLRALIHRVGNHNAEEKLFVVLNSKRRVPARTIIKGWPGPAGEFMHRLNDAENSPVRGMIDFGNNHRLPLDAPAVARALLAVTAGTKYTGDTATVMLPRLDAALKMPGRVAWADAYIQLMTAVFGPSAGKGRSKVKSLPMLALANVAHRHFVAAGRPIMPRSTGRLRQVNWDTVVPAMTQQWVPGLEERIERLWK